MPAVTPFFTRPKLRPGVAVSRNNGGIEVLYRDQGCSIDIGDLSQAEVGRLLDLLQGGSHTPAELKERFTTLADQVDGLLDELDRLGLLTEATLPSTDGQLTGRQFYRELVRFTDRMKRRVAGSEYQHRLQSNQVSRNQLVGYVLEYYHLVHRAPSLVAPALGHVDTPRTRELLQDFLISEMHHDRMLAESLRHVDIDEETLERCEPLSTTFALCATLGALAHQHLLSFKSVLFLFEEPYEEFNTAFEQRSAAVGLPAGFTRPVLKHSRLNEEGEHDEITRALLSEVAAVSPEEQLVVKKHVGITVETLVKLEHHILDYYGDPGNPVPRVFA
jgi:hypothetical protein